MVEFVGKLLELGSDRKVVSFVCNYIHIFIHLRNIYRMQYVMLSFWYGIIVFYLRETSVLLII